LIHRIPATAIKHDQALLRFQKIWIAIIPQCPGFIECDAWWLPVRTGWRPGGSREKRCWRIWNRNSNGETYTKKVPVNDRLSIYIMVSCLSYAIQTSLGSQLSLSPSERKKASVFNSFRQSYRGSSKNYRSHNKIYIYDLHIYTKKKTTFL